MLCPYCGIYNPTGSVTCSSCAKDMTVPPPPGEEYVGRRSFDPNSFSEGIPSKRRRRKRFSIPFIDNLRARYESLPGEQKTKVFLLACGIILTVLVFTIIGTCSSLDLCSRCSEAISGCGKEEVVAPPEKVYYSLGLVGVEPQTAYYSDFYGYWDLKIGGDTICFNPNLTFNRSDGRKGEYEYIPSTNRLYLYYDDENDSSEYFAVWFIDDYLFLGYEVTTYQRGLLGEGFAGTWTSDGGEVVILGEGKTWGPAGQPDKLGYYGASWRYEENLFYYTDYGNMLVNVSGSDLALVSGTDISSGIETCYAFSLDGDELRLISGTIYVRRVPKSELTVISHTDVSPSDVSPTDVTPTDVTPSDVSGD